MKVINAMANKVSGTIDNKVTASNWKGINYLKVNTKPQDPKSELQLETRQYFDYGVGQWHGFTAWQKLAYGFLVRYRKLRISPFNFMVGSCVKQLSEGPNYLAPPEQRPAVVDFHEHFPLDGAEFTVMKAGQTKIYAYGVSADGGIINFVVCREDENFDVKIIRDEYQDYYAYNIQAVAVSDVHRMKLID